MVRLQLKLRCDYAKLKARGQLRNRTRYASATPVAASFDTVMQRNLLPPSTIDEKRSRSMNDPFHDVQKHPRRVSNPAKGEFHTPTSSPTPGTLVNLPVLVLVMTATSFQDYLYIELVFPLLIEQRRWWSVYRGRIMRRFFSN